MRCGNDKVEIRVGDCRELLRAMPDQSVNCIVTSPPYFGLRDYGTAQWEGGDEGCDHKKGTARQGGGRAGVNGFNGSAASGSDKGAMNYADICGKCGARRIDRQIGLESTPDAFVAEMVAVFREARRVLRDDGVCWVNLGDSYAAQGGPGASGNAARMGRDYQQRNYRNGRPPAGLKPKDLIGIPWRVAFALQADGWYLRQDIIWAKPNPMPESVKDRCTKAHEYLFMMTKSARYWYDAEAIKEPATYAGPNGAQHSPYGQGFTRRSQERASDKQRGHGRRHAGFNDRWDAMSKADQKALGRNKRSVWTVATRPYSEAHFATYPPALIEPCILAGCPKSGMVLDPFGGAGTTGLVAARHGRNAILCELNPAYAEMARDRINREWSEPVRTEAEEPLGGLFEKMQPEI